MNNLEHISRMSRRLRMLFTVLLFVIPLWDVLTWLFFNEIPKSFTQPPVDLLQPLISLCLSMANPPGHRVIALTFDAVSIAILITGSIVILISWIMLEGAKLEEEQAHTI